MEQEIRYHVREAQIDKDEKKLAQLLSECFDPTTPRQVRRWIRRVEKESKDWSKSFVAEVDGAVVGNISVELKELHLGEGINVKTGGIGGVCTCSNYRRIGIACNLLGLSLSYVKNSGVSNSSLYTGRMLPAHRIYERFGFFDIETWCVYIKLLDFNYFFGTWLRNLNRHLKVSKIARKTLQNWDRSIVFEFQKFGKKSIRYRHSRFERLSKPPRSPNIIISTKAETLIQVMWGEMDFWSAIRTGKMTVKQGNEADLKILKKVIIRIWGD